MDSGYLVSGLWVVWHMVPGCTADLAHTAGPRPQRQLGDSVQLRTCHLVLCSISAIRIGRGACMTSVPCVSQAFLAACADLRRHKRDFLRLATNGFYARLSDAAAAQQLFAEYLRTQLAS